ncbi:MAG: hypothetical protein HLUCCA05_05400 [Roseibaca calidilacus]|uniref:Uncharacterized protein n=2 Tax=Roseibaca calidilacus TaxID=1666912 RepID=A0A0P7VUR7_9RHOB|nr:MAG: hypothetical protein HLUCCA05_05400 [Roseibaca calidilacus]CUX83672.1 hypothetical protein Ga0058931_3120 [Roseibaca calidilacus]
MQPVLRKLLVPFTLVVIALGLWQVGGPEQARRDYRDDQRASDLYSLAAHIRCERSQQAQAELPCGTAPRDRDRFTNAPYRITPDEICAQFENPVRIASLHNGDIVAGCLSIR